MVHKLLGGGKGLYNTSKYPAKGYSPSGACYFSLCREAISHIINNVVKNNNKVILPAYTCDSVIQPFKQRGCEIYHYDINRTLEINTDSFCKVVETVRPSIVLVHPYYGKRLTDEEIACLKRKQNEYKFFLIVDLTQEVFPNRFYEIGDAFVASVRKWIGIPDGGMMVSNSIKANIDSKEEFEEYVKYEMLKMQSIHETDLYIKYHALSNKIASDNCQPHPISSISNSILKNLNAELIRKQINKNCQYFYSLLKECRNINIIVEPDSDDYSPLYYPIYVENKIMLQKYLLKYNIMAPSLWNVSNKAVLENTQVGNIYRDILCLPCHYELTSHDINFISKKINDFYDSMV